jgi:Glycoside hydrolase 123, catalytic domain/Glycoside hydrolase 123 N-terminal domain
MHAFDRRFVVIALTLCLFSVGLIGSEALAKDTLVPNPNLNIAREDDSKQPAGWTLTKGKGGWIDREILELKSDGEGSCAWQSEPIELEGGRNYRLEGKMRQLDGGKQTQLGTDFGFYDFIMDDSWQWYGGPLRVPNKVSESRLNFKPWVSNGTLQMDAFRVVPVAPVYRKQAGITLGNGESITNGKYRFNGTFSGGQVAGHRVLQDYSAVFRTDIWIFRKKGQVSFRFDVPKNRFASAEVICFVKYHAVGTCVLEASRDGKNWIELARLPGKGELRETIPAELLPAENLYIRARSEGKSNDRAGIDFQVSNLFVEGKLERSAPDMAGQTVLIDLPASADFSQFDGATFSQDGLFTPITLNYPGGQAQFDQLIAGDNSRPFPIKLSNGKTANAVMNVMIPDFYRTDFGQQIETVSGPTAVWWARADHKIPRNRELPTAKVKAARMQAARNDFEAIQLVVRPENELKNLTATATAFTGPDGATIPAANVEILDVYYHFVQYPTDEMGTCDFWPDALPPIKKPLKLDANQNRPLWVLVKVPEGIPAGDYRGTIELKAEGFDASVPIDLTVWDFTLPKRNHLATAYGFSAGNVFRYHGAKSEADRRKLIDLYFQSFADHRMSPYWPVPMDQIKVKFMPKANPPRAEVDFSKFDPAMEEAIEKYNFTHFRLPIQGMGGGTFHSRHAGRIGKFTEDTPEYKAMFKSYVGQLESHLKEKGWLDMAYVYWFDEPDHKDYQFVSDGMMKLKKAAPGLRTMLTEQPEGELKGVDIWCPVTESYKDAVAQKLIDDGAEFWWYVCTGPKAPYCTLFIDHPAVELRTWHWQAWKRRITGSLVWQSTYWTSGSAFPSPKTQNPYEDPMAYVSGYSTPKGIKRFWGNGDGRFYYPPLAAAHPDMTKDKPVIDGPVSSIRLEMIREGVEDWETLYILRELISQKRDKLTPDEIKQYESLLKVPESITVDLTHFSTDPEPIYTQREKIAHAIEALQKQ